MAAEKIKYANKQAGDLWRSTEANEVKAVINSHADDIDDLESSLASVREVATRNSGTLTTHTQRLTALEAHSSAEYHDTTGVGTGGKLIYEWLLNVWEEPIPALDIKLGGSPQNPDMEYRLRFTVRGDSFSLTFRYEGGTAFPVSWVNGEPDWEDGYTYEVSLMGGIAVGAGTVETPLSEL